MPLASNGSAPKVSVIVPSYNHAGYVGLCIESILGQRGFSDLELIVVDDASTDDSAEVIGRFRDPRLVFHRQETNQGHVRNMNDGFRRASGKYLVHVGSDDYWHPDFLATCVPVLDAHPDVGLVHTNYAMVGPDGTVTQPRANDIPVPGGFRGSELEPLLYGNYFPAAGTLFRREGLELVGGRYDEDLPYGEDWRLWLAIARRWNCHFVDEPLVYYRVHEGNLHTGILRSRAGAASEMRILDEVFADPSLPAEIRRQADRVYATHLQRYADGYFAWGLMQDCRSCLRAAAARDRRALVAPTFWKRYLASLVPRGMYRGVQRTYRKIAGLEAPLGGST